MVSYGCAQASRQKKPPDSRAGASNDSDRQRYLNHWSKADRNQTGNREGSVLEYWDKDTLMWRGRWEGGERKTPSVLQQPLKPPELQPKQDISLAA